MPALDEQHFEVVLLGTGRAGVPRCEVIQLWEVIAQRTVIEVAVRVASRLWLIAVHLEINVPV